MNYNDLQVNYLGGIQDLLSIENINLDKASLALPESDAIVQKLSKLPEILLFDIGRYLDAVDRMSITNKFFTEGSISLSRLINIGLEYYIEPHEIPEALEEAISEELKANEDKALGALLFFKGSPLADMKIETTTRQLTGIMVILLEDLIAALVARKTPSINGISAPYRFDSINKNTLVLRKTIEVGFF
jgi:hypothetical protein